MKDNKVLVAEISEKESLFYLSIKYLSYVVGCFGAIGFVLRLFERCAKPIYDYIKKKRSVLGYGKNAYILKNQFEIEKMPQERKIDEISPLAIEVSLSPMRYPMVESDSREADLTQKCSISTAVQLHERSTIIERRPRFKGSNRILPSYK